MKIINYLYESIAEIHCSCCMEYHTMRLDLCKDFEDDILYITIKDADYNFFDRIKNSYKLLYNWKKYLDINEFITSYGILIKPIQIYELYNLLKKNFIEYNIFDKNDLITIEDNNWIPDDVKFPIKWANKKLDSNDFTWILYNDGEFVISIDITYKNNEIKFTSNDILFGYRLPQYMKFKNILRWSFYHIFFNNKIFLGGEWNGSVSKANTIKMMSTFYYLLSNLK